MLKGEGSTARLVQKRATHKGGSKWPNYLMPLPWSTKSRVLDPL